MRLLLLLCCLLMTVFLADSAAPGPPVPFAAQWKKIDALLAKEQTATAAPLIEQLYQQAKKTPADPTYVRALLYKIRLLEDKENDADEQAIALLEHDVQAAQFPARPILHSLLAGLYAHYFGQHRYQLYLRTSGAAPTTDPATPGQADGGTSLATWDARRLGSAIVRHYQQSVQDEPARQLQTTLADLGDLATGGDADGRQLRPTLYDLLAQRAIEGLQNQELTITQPEQAFTLADYPAAALFGPGPAFAALRLRAPAADSLSHELYTLRLLQQLTAQRLRQPQRPLALADVDLQRLDYLHRLGQGPAFDSAYAAALASCAEQYRALPLSTEFVARLAAYVQERPAQGPRAAIELARAAESRFPASRGAARARQLRQELERPEIAFSAAEVVVPGQPWRLDLAVRNVGELHAWAYRLSLKEWAPASQYGGQPLAQRYARALRTAPAATWAVPVPAAPHPYRVQNLAVAGPALPAGYYLVLLSTHAPLAPGTTAAPAGTATAYAVVGASALSAVQRAGAPAGPTLLVLDRHSGAPLAGVAVQATYARYGRPRQQDETRLGAVVATTAEGEATLAAPVPPTPLQGREGLRTARVWQGRDTLLVPINSLALATEAPPAAEPPQRRTFLFTDRASYRPGQTLYFKGILTQALGGQASLLAGQPVSVRLVDVNGQTAQTYSFTTSDFGSFAGSLVLPTGLLNGEMTLQTDDGSLGVAVEDYKRPTFYVQLDSVPGQPRLGQPLAVAGRARAYAGPATDGATVHYRVMRRELWALAAYAERGGPRGGSQEIAHGTTTTDAEGRFSLTFTPPLVPQPAGPRWEPGYLFELTADVTDAAGETRTGTRSVPIGHNPLSLRLAGPDAADARHLPAFTLLGTNATGVPLPATGTLRLLARHYRPAPAGVPGPTPETTDNEAPAELVKTLPFDTRATARLDVAALLAGVPTGRYRLEALAAGADSARAQLDFTRYDSEATTVPFATPDWVRVLADTVAPGQPATLLLGSSEAAHILLEVERGGHLLHREWLRLPAGEQRRLVVASGPATAAGPLYVHTTQVRAGYLYRHDATVQVLAKPQPLHLSIATFRDRLQPGQRETWRVAIRQAGGQPAAAELLATLYDQSLDAFRPHSFQDLAFEPGYSPPAWQWEGSFGQASSTLLPGLPSPAAAPLAYPRLNTWGATDGVAPGGLRGRGRAYGRRGLAEVQVLARATASSALAPAPARTADSAGLAEQAPSRDKAGSPPAGPNLSTVAARTDFRETALWAPALRTDKNGDVVLEFQLPEAVTRWQLLALAHDKSLHTGQLARQLVTQKEIQLTPNAPRFLRPGDAFTFPAKLANLTDHALRGTAQLVLLDAATGQDITSQLVPGPARQAVAVAAHQSTALGWDLRLPADFAPTAVTYRVVAQASGGPPPAPTGPQSSRRGSKSTHGGPKSARQGPAAGLGAAPASQEAAQAGLGGPIAGRSGSHWGGGAANEYADGEQNTLPVLPSRVLLTESLPLPLVGAGTHTFELKKLTGPASPTRRTYSLTLELTANPAWYAVQSLPYLLDYPYQGSEQVFDRLYANLLAAHLLRATPRLKPLLAEWTRQAQAGAPAPQGAPASPLAQNQDLKNLLLQETPWVRDAQGEAERLARLGTLFDEARLGTETARALAQLRAMQQPDGSFAWFERMPADRYLTQLIVAGFGKLRQLGAFDASQQAAAQPLLQGALRYLDGELARRYAQLRQPAGASLAANHLADLDVQALYARSYWPQVPVAAPARAAYAYYRQQAATYWAGQPRYLQAQLALALYRADAQAPAPALILRALAENALHSPTLGMYWQDVRPGYYWREAPTETQATLIEAFAEITHDQPAVDELKLWLLTQKQTQHWPSTRATADACYALLLRGTDWLAPAPPLRVVVGGEPVVFPAAQAGTGYARTTWPAAAITPAQGTVVVTKPTAGVAWGALYWQYYEDLDRVAPAATPLSLERQLYRERATAGGPVLAALTPAAPLAVGDVVVVRLVLRTDRALEYVHLKDQRAAGLEPLSQGSGYRYQAGLGYYESPRDAATNFFLSAVPRGTHVFEYRLRASQAGTFSGGLSQVQCLYAPEFGAHAAGQRLRIAPQ